MTLENKVIYVKRMEDGQVIEQVNEKITNFTDMTWKKTVEGYKLRPDLGELLEVRLYYYETNVKKTLNPKWKSQNDLHEGGEGYNNNEKWIFGEKEIVEKMKVWKK